MAKISIIIPIYNAQKYLVNCLNSIINQTFKDIEIICIDDKSTDNSVTILEEYAQKDNRIKIIKQEVNQGQGIARNLGIKKAIGEFIMFIDPDDWFELDACEKAYNCINKNKTDFCFFGFYRYYQDKNIRKKDKVRLAPFKEDIDSNNIKLYKKTNMFLTTGEIWSLIYNRNFLINNNVEFAPLYICEDNLFFIKAILASETVSYIDIPLYNYRIYGESSTTSCASKWKQLILAKKLPYDEISKSTSKTAYMPKYLVWYINSIIYWFKRFTKIDKTIKKDFYYELHTLFKQLNNENDINEIKQYIDFKKFNKILKYNYTQYVFLDLIEHFFSIKNTFSKNKKYKTITLLGIKIKIRIKQ